MAEHNTTGKTGEERAAEYLISRGYTIRDTNWRNGRLELDIVAYKDKTLVIAEVKTRSSEFYGHPEDAITPQKIKFLISAAEAYIRKYDLPFEVRFDIISVIHKDENYTIEHIPDAFYPPIQ